MEPAWEESKDVSFIREHLAEPGVSASIPTDYAYRLLRELDVRLVEVKALRAQITRIESEVHKIATGDVLETGTGDVLRVHDASKCEGEPCPVHNLSEHHMVDWPTHWRSDRGMMERICPHGVGHPDPDDRSTDRTHGCDGCCTALDDVVDIEKP